MYVLSQIFNTTQNFWIYQISSFAGLLSSQKGSFEPNFQCDSKCLDFAKFQPSQVQSGQNINFEPNFKQDWKFLDFAKIRPQVRSGQKSHLSQI